MGDRANPAVEDLIVRCLRGDARAFNELMNAQHKRVFYYVLRLLKDRDRAEDVSQNVWLDVFRSLHTLKNFDSYLPWLYTIARRHAYRELKRLRRDNLHESLDTVSETEVAAAEASFADTELVHRCLDQLIPQHREVLLLRFVEEMSYEEIALATQCQIGTVKSRIYYAKQAVAAWMEEQI